MPVEPRLPKRPVRATAIGFVGTFAFVVACAPWMPVAIPAEFFGLSAAYCLFLNAFAVGLVLAGRRAYRLLAVMGVVMALGMFALHFWIVNPPAPADPRAFLRQLWLACRVMLTM